MRDPKEMEKVGAEMAPDREASGVLLPADSEPLGKLVQKLKEEMEKKEKEVHTLKISNWLDDYNGYPIKHIQKTGWRIRDDQLRHIIKKLILLYEYESRPSEIKILKIVLTDDGELIVNYSIDMHNDQGTWVGTERKIVNVLELLRAIPEPKDTFKNALKRVLEGLEAL